MILRKEYIQIGILVILGCILMSVIEAILQPTYVLKSCIKICVFATCIVVFYLVNKKEVFLDMFRTRERQSIWIAVGMGILVYVVILVGYIVAKNYIDFQMISSSLLKKEHISKQNFIYVSVYISIINSFLEELFFRGFAFLTLRKYIKESVAYGFSSVSFALYHIFIMSSWFSMGMFLLLLISLAVAGYMFNYFDRKGIIYPSWIIHMSANLGINTVGFMMFGLI